MNLGGRGLVNTVGGVVSTRTEPGSYDVHRDGVLVAQVSRYGYEWRTWMYRPDGELWAAFVQLRTLRASLENVDIMTDPGEPNPTMAAEPYDDDVLVDMIHGCWRVTVGDREGRIVYGFDHGGGDFYHAAVGTRSRRFRSRKIAQMWVAGRLR